MSKLTVASFFSTFLAAGLAFSSSSDSESSLSSESDCRLRLALEKPGGARRK